MRLSKPPLPIVLCIVVGLALGAGSIAALSASGDRQAPPINTTPTAGEVIRTAFTTVVDGHEWSLRVFRNVLGQTCAGEQIPNDGGDGGQAWTCEDPSSVTSSQAPLYYALGARQLPGNNLQWHNAWVWGWADPSVSSVTLQLTNCTTLNLPVNGDHLFFYVFSSNSLRSGIGPQSLVAASKSGDVVRSALLHRPTLANGKPASEAVAPNRANC